MKNVVKCIMSNSKISTPIDKYVMKKIRETKNQFDNLRILILFFIFALDNT